MSQSSFKSDSQVEFFVTRLEALWADKCELIKQNAELKMELMLLKQQPQQPSEPEPEQEQSEPVPAPEPAPAPAPEPIRVIKKVPSMTA